MRSALLLLLLAASAGAKEKAERVSGIVVQSMVKVSPSPDGPAFKEGRLTMTTKDGIQLDLKVTTRTRVTLDGKPAKYHKAAAPGVAVARALYDAKSVALVLDFKSALAPARPANEAESVRGEIANTDIIKNTITVRLNRQRVQDYAVAEGTTIKRAFPGKDPELVALEALQVGDGVELYTADGKTAVTISAQAPK